MRIIPLLKVYDIRGHHLVDITNYLHAPDTAREDYRTRGYGEDFVKNQTRVFDNFISGSALIQLTAGTQDATCLANCQRFTITGCADQLPCEGEDAEKVDTQLAGFFLLRIGETYSFPQIECNLRNFYADQHSM